MGIASDHSLAHSIGVNGSSKIKTALGVVALLFSLAAVLASSGAESLNLLHNPPMVRQQSPSKVVYVCACLKTKSCVCMTEAKTAGPCSCGTAGGPPMKAVPQNSKWAKANRDALAH